MRNVSALLIATLLVAAAAGSVVIGATAGGADTASAPSQQRALQDRPEADRVVTQIQLDSNGSAVWEVRFVTRLDSQSEVDSYESFQATFRNETDRFLSSYRDRIVPVVDRAENETDREMAATGFTARTTVEDSVVDARFGVVAYEFRWGNFARVEGDRLIVGDVFAGGFFLGSNQTLRIEAPATYRIASTDPAPDVTTDRLVRYGGTREFDDGRPRVVAEPVETAATTTATETARETTRTAQTTTPAQSDGGGFPFLLVAGVLALGAVAVAAAYRAGWFGGAAPPSDDGPDGPDTPSDDSPARTDESPAQASAPDAGTDEPAESADPYEAVLAEIRPPLTDEDRVRKALAENGGRMRQSDVADDLDWSASKTSRVLSDMADEGSVEKLRVGRQNVIDLVVDEE